MFGSVFNLCHVGKAIKTALRPSLDRKPNACLMKYIFISGLTALHAMQGDPQQFSGMNKLMKYFL